MKSREASLHRLEGLQDQFFRKMEDAAVKQQAETAKRHTELEEIFAKRNTHLDDQHAERLKQLEQERFKFEEEKKQFDLRDTTAVRRDIVKGVTKLVEDRSKSFKLSNDASNRRWPVLAAYIAMILALGGLAVTFIAKDFNTTLAGEASYILIARQAIFTIACAIAISYFIKWLNHWAQQHADQEFYARRFQLDINRAAFLVETVLEWAKSGEEPPPYLIERLSRNLFDSDSDDVGPTTAADALASALFGSAASLELDVGGNKVALNRKAIRQLQKQKVNSGD